MALAITVDNFAELKAAGKPMMIDFWATWCGPCKRIAPEVEALAEQYAGQITIGKCDIEDNDDLAGEFAVRSIPTLVFIDKDGNQVDKLVGAHSRAEIEAKLQALL